ncbi:ATP-binding protein [Limnobacter alexandrii]|uniref:ATP-binding protein n=1 Tax=Limnobacter alexandrii TaxID=2570352 RepID=UPI001BB18291|nr:ATP-binding protein [Limnobacter alexandrii]
MIIPRLAASAVQRLAKGFPVVAITGPRQSGKTTLTRQLFAHKPYVSLESPDQREFAIEDPKRFLAQFTDGAVIDEVQRVPSLMSWLQGLVDERQRMGDFILTGSQQFDLVRHITQSLAGRVGRVELLPLQGFELRQAGQLPSGLDNLMVKGHYPALYSRELLPQDWFANYVATYVERDVRQLLQIKDLQLFQRFLRLAAARSGQLLNLSALGADAGISSVTAREWIGVLEASYLVMRLPPYFENFGKRLVKTPKLYFLDTGLMCWLLGIHSAAVLSTHPLRGQVFETMMVVEAYKAALNKGRQAELYFWRDSAGQEVDLLAQRDGVFESYEIKSGATFSPDWFKQLTRFEKLNPQAVRSTVIYGGEESSTRSQGEVLAWAQALEKL